MFAETAHGAVIELDAFEAFLDQLKNNLVVDTISIRQAWQSRVDDYRHPEVEIPEGCPPRSVEFTEVYNTLLVRRADLHRWVELSEEKVMADSGIGYGANAASALRTLKISLEQHVSDWRYEQQRKKALEGDSIETMLGVLDLGTLRNVDIPLDKVQTLLTQIDRYSPAQLRMSLIGFLATVVCDRMGVQLPEHFDRVLEALGAAGLRLSSEALVLQPARADC